MQHEETLDVPRQAKIISSPLVLVRHEGALSPLRLSGQGLRWRLDRLEAKATAALADALRREKAQGSLFYFVPVLMGTGAILWFATAQALFLPAYAFLFLLAVALAAVCAHRRQTVFYAASALALVVAGMLFAGFEELRTPVRMLDAPVTATLTGIVESREKDGLTRWRYRVKVLDTARPQLRRPPDKVMLSVRTRHEPLPLGARIEAPVRLTPPAGPALPGLNDFAFTGFTSGIGANGFVLGTPKLLAVAAPDDIWTGIWRSVSHLRLDIGERIRSVIPGDSGAFAGALITGEQRALSRETAEALRVAGLSHIVAVSGLNMALAAGLFFVGGRKILALSVGLTHALPIKKAAAAFAIAGAFGYFLISGTQVSAERAFIMTAIMLGAVLIDRPALSMRNVALAALFILATAPSKVLGPSFQMSFAATVALIAGYAQRPVGNKRAKQRATPWLPPLPQHFAALSTAGRIVTGIVVTSLIGSLSTAVFAADHFHRLSGYGLLANLATMPIISVLVVPAAMVAMLAMPFGLDALPLQVMGLGIDWVLGIATTIAGWGGTIDVPRLPGWFVPIFVSGFLIFCLLHSYLRHMGTLIMAAALTAWMLAPPRPVGDLLIAEDGSLVGLTGGGLIATNKPKPNSFIFDQWLAAIDAEANLPPRVTVTRSKASLVTPTTSERKAAPAPADASLVEHGEAESQPANARATPGGTSSAPGPRQVSGSSERPASRRVTPDTAAPTANMPLDKMSSDEKPDQPARFNCSVKGLCLATHASGWRIATVDSQELFARACQSADLVITAQRIPPARCATGAGVIGAALLRQTGALEITFKDRDALEAVPSFTTVERGWQRHRLYDWRIDGDRPANASNTLAALSQRGTVPVASGATHRGSTATGTTPLPEDDAINTPRTITAIGRAHSARPSQSNQ